MLAALIYMKWSEGRCSFFGLKSKAWYRRQERQNAVVDAPLARDHTEDDIHKSTAPMPSTSTPGKEMENIDISEGNAQGSRAPMHVL